MIHVRIPGESMSASLSQRIPEQRKGMNGRARVIDTET